MRHRSSLGDWRISVGRSTRGPRYLTLLWDVEGQVRYARESILPSGHVELLVNLGAEQYLVDPRDHARRTKYEKVWVSGLQQRNIVVESEGFSHLLGARFTTLGAWRFLGLSMEELRDRVVDAELVVGSRIMELRDALLRLRTPDERLRCLESFLLGHIEEGPEIHESVAQVLQRVARTRGVVAVGDLMTTAGCSHRHLVRKFREQVGVGPKRFCALLRMQRAAEWLKHDPAVNLSDLALSCGFYDQAHFNREFRKFSGSTPSEFVRGLLPDEVTEAMVLG